MGTPTLANVVKALGGIPVNIAAPETYNVLERGVVDGTIFPWEAISPPSTSPRCSAIMRSSNSFVAPLFTLMNQKRYDSSPDLRKVIDDLSGAWGSRLLLRWRYVCIVGIYLHTGDWNVVLRILGQRPSARWLTTC